MTATTVHPSEATLAAFGAGRLPETERLAIEAHVADCGKCCALLERATADTLLGLAQKAARSMTFAGDGEPPSSDEVPAALVDHARYRMIGRLGAGGMGVVYKAEHRLMGRTVALKVLNSRTLTKPAAVERFRREVRLASQLSHANIVTAHDADEAGGQHFLVMEYVDGVSLDRLVARRGPLTVTMACHFIRQAALGLQHAHEKSMVHRDIKPHNLMVTRKGVVKILDFGLACVAQQDGAPLDSAAAAYVTGPEVILGTPDFLAPEQYRSSKGVDIHADLYALGCTLFYLLTGRPPFNQGTPIERLLAHVQDTPPRVTDVRPDVPGALSDVILKLMAKAPQDRYHTPAEVAAALLPFAKGTEPPPVIPDSLILDAEALSGSETKGIERFATPTEDAKAVRPRRRKKNPARRPLIIGGGLIAAVVLIGGVWGLTGALKRPTNGGKPSDYSAKGTPERQAASGPPQVLLVLPTKDLWRHDLNVRPPLERAGIKVLTAAGDGTAVTMHKDAPGAPMRPDMSLAAVRPSEFTGVVFMGAGVEDYQPGRGFDADVRRIVDHMKNDKLIGAICRGQEVLGKLGYLDGKRTSKCEYYKDPPSSLRMTNNQIEEDGQITTAGSFHHAAHLGERLAAKIKACTQQSGDSKNK